ncbi:LacI family DNA-binding transcriptional regulator [Foetidibacter luteolus]|uniref:LacI family DNA-binding transcriptional regulator n=1 Tax=Foetidibacter luteolus TaxID=2608880 RepID=UPI00129B45EA|nr:LacI family DNA-binding transcriptional regulator [Foetidibacter luteolus]
MKKPVTIKDIARKLNMSVSAVSKALNNDKSISTLTRERVAALASEWNYVRNETARHFQQSKSFTVGIIVPAILDQFYALAINGVEKIALEQQYNVILSQSHEDFEVESKIVNMMIRNRVDGVIVALSKQTVDTSSFNKLATLGIPIVYIARMPKNPDCHYVSSDNFGGAYKGTEFLIKKKGHHRIAHIKGPDEMYISHIRHEGYMQALKKYGIEYDDKLVTSVDFSKEATYAAMEQLMALAEPPTAILTFKNYITLDALQFLRTRHPDKINSIDFVGFGFLPLLEYIDHKPTASVAENSYDIGISAMRLLLELMRDETEDNNITPKHIEVACKLVVHK